MASEHLVIKFRTGPAKDVALDIFIAESAVRVNVLQYANKVVKTGIQFSQRVRAKRVCFHPMGTPTVA